jgi:RNA polymerase sigma-70 factor, ECF subfamily
MEAVQAPAEDEAVVAAAKTGNQGAFGELFERYRRELHVHCYRMLGSFEDAEDLVQETFLRAWRRRETFQGRSSFRAWLYRIATNACLDHIASKPRRAAPASPEVSWLQPYPDQLLEGIAPSEDEPDAAVVEKETIELAFLAAIQHLPPRQRAVLILRDVLGWSASETASLLETTVASVNSALQRARGTLKTQLPRRRAEWAPDAGTSAEDRALVDRYVEATEHGDADAILELLHEEARFTMPPQPGTWVGREEVVRAWVEGGFGQPWFGELRCITTRANRQPAVACYHRAPGNSEFVPLAIDVLMIEDGEVVDVTAFEADVFEAFGLPPKL